MARIINVGLIGLGTVGTGVAQHLEKRGKQFGMQLKTIAVANKKKSRDTKIPLTTNVDAIINDPAIDIVVELIGGIQEAKDYIVKALKNKKSVVTANKAVLARYTKEIFSTARENSVDVAFEASVGGGIPIIQILRSLRGEKITKIMGILNGTTNYILTCMEEGLTFEKALNAAQKNGFAEKNHILDTGGFDARDKLAILAMLVYNTQINPDEIHCEGITNITPIDLDFAKRYGEFEGNTGYTIKLLAIADNGNDTVHLRVHPALIPSTHPLASVKNEVNAVYFEGELAGPQLHTGRGAGRLATTSAVFADIIRVAQNIRRHTTEDLPTLDGKTAFDDANELERPGYIRTHLLDEPGSGAEAYSILAKHGLNIGNSVQSLKYEQRVRGKLFVPDIVTVRAVSENRMKKVLNDLRRSKRVIGKPIFIRFEE